MKVREPHASGVIVFPAGTTRRSLLTDNGTYAAFCQLGYTNESITTCCFKTIARVPLDKELGFHVDLTEHQVAYAVNDWPGGAFNCAKHPYKSALMMQC